MKNRLLVYVLLCLPGLLFAFEEEMKADKFPGYVITPSGEKKIGQVIPGSITDNEVKVKFIPKGSGKAVIYKPMDIQGYGYEKEELNDVGRMEKRWLHYEQHTVDYPPKPFAAKTVFMQREIEGTLNLYCYYIEVRNNPKQPYRYIYYYKEEGGKKLKKIEKEAFNSMAKSMFTEYKALATSIGKKNFNYKNLERMVRDYNYWTVNQHDADTYRVALKE